MFFSRHKIFIRFLLHLVLFLIFSDFCFENSITNCNPGDDDRKPAALTISEMQADTKQRYSSVDGITKVVRANHKDADGLDCTTVCRSLAYYNITMHDSCDTACGPNSEQIANELEKQSHEQLNNTPFVRYMQKRPPRDSKAKADWDKKNN